MILNLHQVTDRLWRSGQPNGPDDWADVSRLGVRRVVKLNEANTGSDAYYCDAVGIELCALPIPDWEAQSILTDPGVLEHIDAAIDGCPGIVLVHCTEGVDRTGIAIARYRVRRDRWTKGAALEEWVAYGSHKYKGLEEAWNQWQP